MVIVPPRSVVNVREPPFEGSVPAVARVAVLVVRDPAAGPELIPKKSFS
jgi:hypothetical protein